jgi:hypothetical protein
LAYFPGRPSRSGYGAPAAEGHVRWAAEATILEALGNLGDFVGGVAVVVTILYLAYQVRQNTAALRVSSRQDIVESYRSYLRPGLEDPTLLALQIEGHRSYPDLSQPDRMRFAVLLTDQALHFQGALALHESGTLDDETFRAYRDHFAASMSTPGGSAFWSANRSSMPSDVVDSIEARINEGGLRDILDNPAYRS